MDVRENGFKDEKWMQLALDNVRLWSLITDVISLYSSHTSLLTDIQRKI